jgi:ABC-2 type transport system ATP-binding protein
MSDSSILIEADGLCKYYGPFTAIENVSFQIRRGEVVAFLGPNGAGKSTTMKILTGFLAPSAGTARIAGFNMSSERIAGARHLGYLPENGPLYPDMTPKSLLEFFADARGMTRKSRQQRMEWVIEMCNLSSVLGKPIGKLSRGFRQRVGMARVLLHDPDVLILDEPTSGLDPIQIHEVRKTIRALGETKTILLSTHILQEVEAMTNRILFIADGRLKYDGSVSDFVKDQTLEEHFCELGA